MDIYEVRAEIDYLEDELLQAYDKDDEEHIQLLKKNLAYLKDEEERLQKLR